MKLFNCFFVCLLLIALNPAGAEARKMKEKYNEVKIVILGDTYSSGYQLDESQTYARLLRNRFNEIYTQTRIEVLNLSREGYTSANAVSAIPTILAHKPDLLVLALGGDDALFSIDPAITYRSLEQIISILTHNNIFTLIVGFETPKDEDLAYAMEYDRMFHELASKYQLSFYPNLLESVQNDPNKRLFDSPYPDEDGMRIIAENLYGIIRRMLISELK